MIASTRPRILHTPESLAALRKQWQDKAPAAVALVKQADLDLRPGQYGGTDLCWNLGLAYLITGDAKYADRAIALTLLEVEKGLALWSYDKGFHSRDKLANAAICLDWCWDRLTPPQIVAIEQHLRGWVDWIWKNGYHRDNPAGNYYWGHVWGTMAAALALGDETMYALANDRRMGINSYLKTIARGGWLHDGFSYGGGMIANLMLTGAAWHTADTGGVEFTTYDTDLMRCLIAATLPDTSGVVPFGDQSDDAKNKWNDRDLLGPRICQAFATEEVDLVRDWLMATLPRRKVYTWQKWAELMFPVAGAVEFSLPRASFYVAEGAGFAAVSSGDLKLFFRCGANLADHADLAANQLMVYRGSDPVLGIARCNAHNGTERDTNLHNCITVDDRAQVMNNPLSKLDKWEDTPQYTYLRGEAPDAYQYKELTGMGRWLPLLEACTCEVLFLKAQEAVVVRHKVRKVKPESVVTLHTQCLGKPQIAAGMDFGVFSCDVGQSEMFCTPVLPISPSRESNTTELKLSTNRPDTGPVTSWRRDITALGSNKEDTFLLVFQFGRIGFAPLPVSLDGPLLKVGDANVSVATDLFLIPPTPPAPPKPTLEEVAKSIEALANDMADDAEEIRKRAVWFLDYADGLREEVKNLRAAEEA